MKPKLSTIVIAVILGIVMSNLPIPDSIRHTRYYFAALLLLPFFAAPILLYLTQRLPVGAPIEMVPNTDPTIPVHHATTIAELAHSLSKHGFKPISANFIRCSDPAKHAVGTVAVFQNEITSDIASVLGIQAGGSLLGFSRYRSDGSRLRTVFSSQPTFFPPRPGDDVVRLKGVHDVDWLWMFHCARVDNDSTCVRNALTHDLLGYQLNEEEMSNDTMVRIGYFTPTAQGTKLRITIKGAIMASLKGLWPTSLIFKSQNTSRVNALIKTLNIPTEEDYRERHTPKATRADEFKRSLPVSS